jgi:hypothetical protein
MPPLKTIRLEGHTQCIIAYLIIYMPIFIQRYNLCYTVCTSINIQIKVHCEELTGIAISLFWCTISANTFGVWRKKHSPSVTLAVAWRLVLALTFEMLHIFLNDKSLLRLAVLCKYKNWIYRLPRHLHFTARNRWRSLVDPQHYIPLSVAGI